MSTATKRAIRTALQTMVAVAAVVPLVAAYLADNGQIADALPWLAAAAPAAAVAAGFARVMALPAVESFLDRFGLGLVDDGGESTE
ncbi:hypothetical protein OG864_29665 [Streptomyces sp. NBC_00124]|uniref:hypothetical protein n=1 Tax=Streptomyces sp. NBC_00124 TaxID=2975662 RepID=UPI00224EFD89|nr:hypothetical protein [Streptomyces sp. NBC_00124]MCX5362869.1 hypothetical protein [Streptomyces sp. NBC_00124]